MTLDPRDLAIATYLISGVRIALISSVPGVLVMRDTDGRTVELGPGTFALMAVLIALTWPFWVVVWAVNSVRMRGRR